MFVDDGAVKKWVGGLAESTAANRLPLLEDYLGFVGIRPGEAVRFQRESPMSYRFVDAAYEWIEKRGLRVGTMKVRVGMIRGFFLANRAPLPKDKHRFHSDKAPVIGELSVEEFKKILLSCNRTYRAAYLVQFQSGSGVGELLYINTYHAEHVWSQIRKDKKIIRLTMPGRKQNRNVKPYYTFIGSDAVEALKQHFQSRGWRKDTVLFRNEQDQPVNRDNLTSYFRTHAIKMGVMKAKTWPCLDCGGETVKQLRKGDRRVEYVCVNCQNAHLATEYGLTQHERAGVRYRARTHELRDLFRTQWHYAQQYARADPSVGEHFMGHSIDPLKYDKIMRDVSYAMSQYRLAVSWLNVLSEQPQKIDRTEVDEKFEASEAKVDALSRELARYRRDSETLSGLAELVRHDPELRRIIRERLKQK